MIRATLCWPREVASRLIVAAVLFMGLALPASAVGPPPSLELSRPVRPWEFLSSVGERAGLLGNEAGNFEAWVYPLKILRDFHLRFLVDGHVVPAEALARTLTVRPESSTILYAGDTFSVRETFFVPVHEPGAVIIIEVETASPLDVQVEFERDFQLEWPAAVGGTYGHWDPAMNAFYFGEEQKKFSALVGSPTAGEVHEEYDTNYSSAKESSFHLGVISKGKETRVVVIAGSVHGQAEAEATYHRLESSYAALLKESADYFRAYLDNTVSVDLPDRQLQQSYDWARVSVLQGLVSNPYLGTGLIAGYRTSGGSQRPGFAWFFGRDSLWTALALDAEGDFGTTRTALDFLNKYQRADGKVPHEISQGANFVPWFTDYPYPYASADATPLYIIAMNDYVVASGDVAFAQQKWDSLWKAYQFLLSTYDAQGLPQNFGIGHGWVEGGPLLPVHTELYQSALGAEALRAQILGAEVNRRKVAFQVKKSDVDQHVSVQFPVAIGASTLRLRIRDDFGLSISPVLPALGSASQGLRVLSESWTPARDTLTLEVAGAQGRQYEIGMWNAAQVASVEGAELVRVDADRARVNVTIPASTSEPNPHEKIVIHFISKAH